MSDDSEEEDDDKRMEAKTPRVSSLSNLEDGSTKEIVLPQLIGEVISNMPILMNGLLKHPDVDNRRFSNGDERKPFGLVRLQAVELFTHMVYVRVRGT
jgi:hypothetical protein